MNKTNYPNWIIIHHTGGTDENPLASTKHHTFGIVNEYHRKKWNFKSSLGLYAGYHYFIDYEGNITQARAENEEGAHTLGMNTSSIGICLAGNFDRPKEVPSKEQKDALKKLLKEIMARHNIPAKRIVPHRHFSSKTCYGKNLKDDWASRMVDLAEFQNYQEKENVLKKKIALIEQLVAVYKSLVALLQIFKARRMSGIFKDKYL